MAVVSGVLAFAFAVGAGIVSAWFHLPFPGLGGFVLTILVAVQVAILLHEAGHLIGARLVGFRPRLLAAFLVRVAWVDGRARLEAPRRPLRWSGIVIATPTGDHNLERRTAGFIGGGPAASLLLGALLGAAAIWLAPGISAYVLLYCADFSLIFGCLTLMPYRSGGTLSDGARLLRLWQGGEAAQRDAALWAIGALVSGDDRPRAVPQGALDRLLAPQDQSGEQAQAEALAAMCALDREEVSDAVAHMQRAMALIEHVPLWMRPGYYLEAAYMTARHEADPVRASAYLEKSAGGVGIEPWQRARAGAAVALAAGDHTRALALAREGLQALSGRQATGLIQMERDLLEDLAARAAEGHAV